MFVFYIMTVLYWFSIYTYVPQLTPYVRSLGGSLTMAGIVIGSYGISQMMLRIPLGIWSDRAGRRKPFILAGIVMGTLSSVGFALTASVWSALIFRFLAGAAAAVWVIFTVLYASYYDHDHATKAMGIISFYAAIGQATATTVGGFISQVYGWHGAFWLATIGGAFALLFAFWIKENPPLARQTLKWSESFKEVGRDKIVIGASLLAALTQIITFSTMFGFTPEVAVSLGASKVDLSWLTLAAIAANALAARMSGGFFANRLGERRSVMIGFAMAAIFTAMIPFVHSLRWLYLTQALNGFGQGICMPVLMGLAIQHIAPNLRATAMGLNQAVFALGMSVGPILTGTVGDLLSLQGAFLLVGSISLLALVISFLIVPRSMGSLVYNQVKRLS